MESRASRFTSTGEIHFRLPIPPGTHHPLGQYFGIMGALTVDQVDGYFIGPFWESFIALQIWEV